MVRPTSCTVATRGSFPREGGQGMILVTCGSVVQRIRINLAIPLVLLCVHGMQRDNRTLLNIVHNSNDDTQESICGAVHKGP